MKRLLAMLTALACILSLNLTAFAADRSIVGLLVDGDGDIANDSYDTIKPGDDYYYVIGKSAEGYSILTDDDIIKFSLKKREGSKYISDADIIEKTFHGTRYTCIKISVKDNFSSDEYKVVLEANFRARKDLYTVNYADVVAGTAFPKFEVYNPNRVSPYSEITIGSAKQAYENALKAQEEAKKKDDEAKVKLDNATKALNDYKSTYDAALKAQTDASAAITAARTKLAELETAVVKAKNQLAEAQANLQAVTATTNQTDALKKVIQEAETIQSELRTLEATRQNILTSLDQHINAGTTPGTDLGINNYLANKHVSKTVFDVIGQLDSGNPSMTADFTSYPWLTTAIKPFFVSQQTTLANALVAQQGTIDQAKAQLATIPVALAGNQYQNALDKVTNSQAAYNNGVIERDKQIVLVNGYQKAIDDFTLVKAANDQKAAAVTTATTEKSNAEKALKEANDRLTAAKHDYDNSYNVSVDGIDSNGFLRSGETMTTTFRLWIQNENRQDDDATFVAGEKGVVIKPVKNEKNTVTWENSNGAIARMMFTADSDVDYYCPRLSTKWNSSDYEDYFEDQDAYLFDFIGNPSIPATTRATLELYNPFTDSDGDPYIDPDDLYVYEVIDGELVNITRRISAGVNDDGDEVLTIKTRTLGTYIVCEERADLPNKRPPNNNQNNNGGNSTPPSNVTNNGKPVPNTGK